MEVISGLVNVNFPLDMADRASKATKGVVLIGSSSGGCTTTSGISNVGDVSAEGGGAQSSCIVESSKECEDEDDI